MKPEEQNYARSEVYDRNARRTKSLCTKGIEMTSHNICMMPLFHSHYLDNLIVFKALDLGKERLGR